MVEISEGRGPKYLENKFEIEESSAGDFEAFSTVLFSSFLAGYNCLQQLYINKEKTNNFPILSAFQIDWIRVGQTYQTKIALSSDQAG